MGCFKIPPKETKGEQLNGDGTGIRKWLTAKDLVEIWNLPEMEISATADSKSDISQNTKNDENLRYIPKINNN